MSWICTVCDKPVANGAGYISVEDSETGGYPRHATDRDDETKPTAMTAAEIVKQLSPPAITFRVYHADCDPRPQTTTYWFGVEEAATLKAWCRWVAQLSTKVWICKYDLKRMLQFWWENRGESLWEAIDV